MKVSHLPCSMRSKAQHKPPVQHFSSNTFIEALSRRFFASLFRFLFLFQLLILADANFVKGLSWESEVWNKLYTPLHNCTIDLKKGAVQG